MADTVLRFDADVSQVTVKFKKVGDEAKKAGEQAARSFDWSKDLNKTLDAVPKKLLSVAAAIAAVNSVIDASNKVASQTAGYAKEKNSLEVRAAAASVRAGGSVAANRAYIDSNAGDGKSQLTTISGRTDFLTGIGQIQDERRKAGLPAISNRSVEALKGYYTSGGDILFGQGGADLLEAARSFPYNPSLGVGRMLAGRNGRQYNSKDDINGMIGGALRQIPEGAITALSQQSREEMVYRAKLAGASQENLSGQTQAEYFKATHPYGSAVQDIGAEFAGKIGLGAPADYVRRRENTSGGVKAQQDIQRSLEKVIQGNPVLPNRGARDERRP